MNDKDDFSEQGELFNKQKLLKALVFDELVRLTYSESENCDGERLAALAKIAQKRCFFGKIQNNTWYYFERSKK